jgi:hypothetical protein
VLFVAVFFAAAGAQGAGAPKRIYQVGRTSIEIPADLPAEGEKTFFNASLDVGPRVGLDVDVFDYNWRNAFNGLTAESYVALSTGAANGLSLAAPVVEGTFQGYPSWTFTTTLMLPRRHGGDAPVSVTERCLVVRRRWSFVVVHMMDATAFFNEDAHYFDEIVGGIALKPEPPGTPGADFGFAALIALGAVSAAIVRKRAAPDRF